MRSAISQNTHRQDGFFDETSTRGDAPDDWDKTPGSAVVEVKAANDLERKKIKTKTVGVEKIEIELDQGRTGLVGFQNNLARYNQLIKSYASMQDALRQQYTAANPGARESTKDGIVTVYAPKKYRPATVSYGASGPSITYPDLAYHHNVSFLQLRRTWNFCMAYAKKDVRSETHDRPYRLPFEHKAWEDEEAGRRPHTHPGCGVGRGPDPSIRPVDLDGMEPARRAAVQPPP